MWYKEVKKDKKSKVSIGFKNRKVIYYIGIVITQRKLTSSSGDSHYFLPLNLESSTVHVMKAPNIIMWLKPQHWTREKSLPV